MVIERDVDLEPLVDEIRGLGAFAYDTEFIGEEHYDPFICVVQVSTPQRVAIVDPIAGVDITPILELIADPKVETIVHAGQQDLEPVVRALQRAPAAIFDTQIAAAFVDRPYPLGLRSLVEECVGVALHKALTFTRWDKRPLSPVHVHYAADDVRYLHAIRADLARRLDERGAAAWVREECDAFGDLDRYGFDAADRFRKLLGARSFSRRQQGILFELVLLRDELARAADVPPRTLMKDDVLGRLAKSPPKQRDHMRLVRNLPNPVVDQHGDAIMEAIERGRNRDRSDLPYVRTVDESPADRVGIDGLWAVACASCHARGVDPTLVTSRREVAVLFDAFKRGGAERVAELELTMMAGWRAQVVGDELLRLLQGGGVEFKWAERLRKGE